MTVLWKKDTGIRTLWILFLTLFFALVVLPAGAGLAAALDCPLTGSVISAEILFIVALSGVSLLMFILGCVIAPVKKQCLFIQVGPGQEMSFCRSLSILTGSLCAAPLCAALFLYAGAGLPESEVPLTSIFFLNSREHAQMQSFRVIFLAGVIVFMFFISFAAWLASGNVLSFVLESDIFSFRIYMARYVCALAAAGALLLFITRFFHVESSGWGFFSWAILILSVVDAWALWSMTKSCAPVSGRTFGIGGPGMGVQRRRALPWVTAYLFCGGARLALFFLLLFAVMAFFGLFAPLISIMEKLGGG
jgi:hypothetical protein